MASPAAEERFRSLAAARLGAYRGGMVTLEPVVCRVGTDIVPFGLWPIADVDTEWLRLYAGMGPAEVGTAVWSLLFHTGQIGDSLAVLDTPAAALRLLGEFDTLYAPGGLVLRDPATGVAVEPGCCCDLFEWRDWLSALHGRPVDLGHSPAPELEYRGHLLRVWTADGDELEPRAYRSYVDVDRATLPDLLRAAQRDLVGFLDAARHWCAGVAPEQTDQFVATLDAGLRIREPLPL